MQTVIATILISALVLGLTTIGIELWRNNMELVQLAAVKVDEREKIKAVPLLETEAEVLAGSDVIAAIRYYRLDDGVTVEVNRGAQTKVYLTEDYDDTSFLIPFEAAFQAQRVYEAGLLKRIIYTQN